MSLVADKTSLLLGEMVHATAVRHRVLAGNLANVETPEYQAQETSFSLALDQARGTPQVTVAVTPEADAAPRRDGNTVDLDQQMVKLAQNTNWHMGLLQMLTTRFAMMRAAIKDR